MKTELKILNGCVKVYVNELPYLSFPVKDYNGFKSEIDTFFVIKEHSLNGVAQDVITTRYLISIFLDDKKLTLEWQQRNQWEQLLKVLDTIESKVALQESKESFEKELDFFAGESKLCIPNGKDGKPEIYDPQIKTTTTAHNTERYSLFKTEDGVDVYKNETPVWYVDTDFQSSGTWVTVITPMEGYKYFSTEQLANDYIHFNKPFYSVKQFKKLEDAFRRLVQGALINDSTKNAWLKTAGLQPLQDNTKK